MIKSAMITEYWTPQSNHRDTFFSIYLVSFVYQYLNVNNNYNKSTLLLKWGRKEKLYLKICNTDESKAVCDTCDDKICI